MSRYLQLVNFLCYCVSISSVNISPQRISLDDKGETDVKYEESENTFLVHYNWTLKEEPFFRVSAHGSMACALQCRSRVVCLSFNFAVYSRRKNCELLQGDKYTSPNNFQPSPLYHDHYSRIVSTYKKIFTLFCVCAVFHDTQEIPFSSPTSVAIMQSDSGHENYINRNFIIVGLETLCKVRKVFDPLSIFIFLYFCFCFYFILFLFIYLFLLLLFFLKFYFMLWDRSTVYYIWFKD